MLDKNTSLVWEYLKNHFNKTNSPVYLANILSTGLSHDDAIKSIEILENKGYINVNLKYPTEPIESINII